MDSADKESIEQTKKELHELINKPQLGMHVRLSDGSEMSLVVLGAVLFWSVSEFLRVRLESD